VTVTTAIYPDVPEVYVKTAQNAPDRVVQKGHANVKDPRAEEIYVVSVKNVEYAVNADAVIPAQGEHARELSVLIAKNVVSAIKLAVALLVHVDVILHVA